MKSRLFILLGLVLGLVGFGFISNADACSGPFISSQTVPPACVTGAFPDSKEGSIAGYQMECMASEKFDPGTHASPAQTDKVDLAVRDSNYGNAA